MHIVILQWHLPHGFLQNSSVNDNTFVVAKPLISSRWIFIWDNFNCSRLAVSWLYVLLLIIINLSYNCKIFFCPVYYVFLLLFCLVWFFVVIKLYIKKKEDSLYFGCFLKAVNNDISKIRGVWIKLRKLKEEYCCSLKNNMLQWKNRIILQWTQL